MFGFDKIIIDIGFDEIFGVHITRTNAIDLISEIVVAMDSETTIFDIAKAIYPHPAFSKVVWRVTKNVALKFCEWGMKHNIY